MASYLSASFIGAFAALGLAHAQTFTLHRQFRTGEVDKYSANMKMSMTMSFAGAGGGHPMNMSADQDLTFQTQKLLPAMHSAEVQLTTTVKNMDFGAMSGMMGNAASKIPKVTHTEGTLDWRNRFATKSIDNAMASSFMNAMGSTDQSASLLIELPDRPVHVGDSWNMEIPQLKALGVTGKAARITLVGTGQIKGHPVLKVRISGSVPIDTDMAKMLSALSKSGAAAGGANPFAAMPKGMSMHMVGTMGFDGTGAIDARSAKTAVLNLGVKTDLTVHISMPKSQQTAGMGAMSMKMAQKMSMTARLAGY